MKKPINKLLKIGLIIVAVLVLIIGIVAIFISPIAKNYIEKHDRELLGRSIRMERLRLNIFNGRMRVEDLRIGGANDSTTFFRLDSFDMRLRLWPLLSQRVDVAYITFVTPNVKIYQKGPEFNFDGILNHFQSDTAEIEQSASKPWVIAINDIVIRSGHLFYKDLLLDATWGLNDIDLQIPGVYFSGEETDVGAELNFAEGGSLSTQVAYDMETSAFDIGLHLRDLTLAGVLPYFRQFLDVSAVDGKVSSDVSLKGDAEHLLSVRIEGTASVTGFRMLDNLGREAMAVDTLHIALREGDLGKMRFDFDKFYVGGFSTFFEMTPTSNNFSDLILPESTEQAESTTPNEVVSETPAPSLHIANLNIRGGRFSFRDLTLARPFEYRLSNITLQGRDFTPEGRNKLTADAHMQKTGSARLVWEGSVSDINNQNITFVLTNVRLRDLSPYCEHYTAYPITEGNLSFRSQNVIRNRNLDGTNHLDVYEPRVDKKHKEQKTEFNIPLKLGLYVLKDKKGHVKMDLPVQGSLDSPEFSYKKIILKTIGNVLLKVVSTPFSFLTGHHANFEYINIDPQQYVFSSEQYASFDKIAQILQEKPEMKIALTQRVNIADALPAQAANALRMAYSRSLQQIDSTVQQSRISMLEYEKIQQIDIRTPAVAMFADSMLRLRGIAPQSVSRSDKALVLYREEAKAQIAHMMSMRDKTLADYMSATHNLLAPAFTILPQDSTAAAIYNGKHRYTITLEVDGETIEIGMTPESNDMTGPSSETTIPEEGSTENTIENRSAAPVADTTSSAAETISTAQTTPASHKVSAAD